MFRCKRTRTYYPISFFADGAWNTQHLAFLCFVRYSKGLGALASIGGLHTCTRLSTGRLLLSSASGDGCRISDQTVHCSLVGSGPVNLRKAAEREDRWSESSQRKASEWRAEPLGWPRFAVPVISSLPTWAIQAPLGGYYTEPAKAN